MAANNENSFAERDPEELFCLKWNDFTVINSKNFMNFSEFHRNLYANF